MERGLDFSTPRLYILDGGKALAAAVRKHAGEAAFIQRCQVHKKRNVVDHLPDEHKADVKRKLQNAYAMADYAEAKRALDRLHRELMDLNPSAARSLEEGMEETLTVHKLRVPDQLRRTLCCTNVIESAFSIVETVCRNVKRWREAITSSAGLARDCWSPNASSAKSSAIARFLCCCLRWPMPSLRNRLRKELLSRNL